MTAATSERALVAERRCMDCGAVQGAEAFPTRAASHLSKERCMACQRAIQRGRDAARAERERQARAGVIERGVCVQCKKAPAKPGRRYCAPCSPRIGRPPKGARSDHEEARIERLEATRRQPRPVVLLCLWCGRAPEADAPPSPRCAVCGGNLIQDSEGAIGGMATSTLRLHGERA